MGTLRDTITTFARMWGAPILAGLFWVVIITIILQAGRLGTTLPAMTNSPTPSEVSILSAHYFVTNFIASFDYILLFFALALDIAIIAIFKKLYKDSILFSGARFSFRVFLVSFIFYMVALIAMMLAYFKGFLYITSEGSASVDELDGLLAHEIIAFNNLTILGCLVFVVLVWVMRAVSYGKVPSTQLSKFRGGDETGPD